MTEADFEREANKLLRDLGLPSDTLNFFESDSAKTSNWKSTLKAPSPPRARRVSSTGTTTQFQRRQRERAATATASGPNSIKRPERTSIPFRNPPLSQADATSSTSTSRASAKNRFSTPSGVSSSIPISSSSVRAKSQSPPAQSLSDQPPAPAAPQASSTPTKRQVHRPAPRAPPSSYQSGQFRRESTPSRTTRSVSPTGPAQKSSTTTTSQGSGIPVFNRRISPAASTGNASTTNTGAAANSNKPSHLQKPVAKTTVSSISVSRPAPPVVSAAASTKRSDSTNSSAAAYESIDGNLVSRSTTKSSSPPKQSMLKKPGSSLSPPKHPEINRRLSAPEKHHNGHSVAGKSESQVVTDERGGTKAGHKQPLQLLSESTKTSATQTSKQTSKPTTDAKAAANSSKPVRPEYHLG